MRGSHNDFCLFSYPENSKRVIWEITHRCNLSCMHCCASATFDGEISRLMNDKSLLSKRIDEMIDFGVGEFYISGGEPFILKNIFFLLRVLKEKKTKVKIATNGTLLNEKIIKKLEKLKIDLVHISLDGPTAEIHDSFRQVKCFDNIIKNIKLLKKHKLNVRVGCIIWRGNEKCLDEMAKLCVKLGADELRLGRLISVGRYREFPEIAPKNTIGHFVQKFRQIRKKYGAKMLISMHRNDDNQVDYFDGMAGCIGGDKLFFIDAGGRVSPCSWLAKSFSEFTSRTSVVRNSFRHAVKSPQMKKFLDLENKRRAKGIYGCPFISKLEEP